MTTDGKVDPRMGRENCQNDLMSESLGLEGENRQNHPADSYAVRRINWEGDLFSGAARSDTFSECSIHQLGVLRHVKWGVDERVWEQGIDPRKVAKSLCMRR